MEKLSSRERFLPLKKLAELWLFDFMQNEDIYLKTLIPTIISGDFSNFTKKESGLLNEIKTNFKKSEWKNFKTLFLNAIKFANKFQIIILTFFLQYFNVLEKSYFLLSFI